MHSLAVALAPILAAEKSKVPFYVAGGALVVWALVVSLGLGLRKAEFPGNESGQRIVGAITVVLVLAAASTAVLTSGGKSAAATPQPAGETASAASPPAPTAPTATTPAPAAPTATTPAPVATATTPAPTATTPAPTATTPAAPTATTPPAPPAAPAAAATALKLAADPGGLLAFDAKTLSAKAGAVTITFTNGSPVEHNLAIAQGASAVGSTPTFQGGSKTLTVKLKPGTYTFFCSVPGHRQAGMEGTLTVS